MLRCARECVSTRHRHHQCSQTYHVCRYLKFPESNKGLFCALLVHANACDLPTATLAVCACGSEWHMRHAPCTTVLIFSHVFGYFGETGGSSRFVRVFSGALNPNNRPKMVISDDFRVQSAQKQLPKKCLLQRFAGVSMMQVSETKNQVKTRQGQKRKNKH